MASPALPSRNIDHLVLGWPRCWHEANAAKRLPLNLLDALRALEQSSVLKSGLGEGAISSYLKLKHDDWNAYSRHLTEWERQTTLDC